MKRVDGTALERCPRLVNPAAEAPGAIRTDKAVHTGACTTQEGRHLRRVSAHRTHQEAVERQQVTRPGAAEDGTPLGLLFWRNLP
jgi:hypothetical protein